MPDARRTTVRGLLDEGRRSLRGLRGVDPGREARLLLKACLGWTDLEILAYPERPVPAPAARRYRSFLRARRARTPFAYLVGEKEFWSIPFSVSPAVLIPRPETEHLVEAVLEAAPEGEPVIVEIGAGSGAVAVALAKELPSARLYAVEISRPALRVARRNAERHGASHIVFLAGDAFAPLRRAGLAGRVDIVAANPPYIPAGDWRGLQPEVRRHEPRLALVSGPTGLELIRRLIREAPGWLKPGGRLILEIGAGQARAVRRLFDGSWDEVSFRRDLRGVLRIAVARRA